MDFPGVWCACQLGGDSQGFWSAQTRAANAGFWVLLHWSLPWGTFLETLNVVLLSTDSIVLGNIDAQVHTMFEYKDRLKIDDDLRLYVLDT